MELKEYILSTKDECNVLIFMQMRDKVMASVLVVDDEPMIRLLLRQALEFDNFEVSASKI